MDSVGAGCRVLQLKSDYRDSAAGGRVSRRTPLTNCLAGAYHAIFGQRE